ncbi:hypothetical protein RchiOBHm_Chr3g0479371 [Rosa chinensis]|uniref:Uncharacterized protein n=1 Tax=Rosa chinensis TaxID=74649 RepID=A0A2P6RDC2_ROSCH|nr:hypothetical protein RchiOBHm_Chr3g0479371 [Rosa chinensis]
MVLRAPMAAWKGYVIVGDDGKRVEGLRGVWDQIRLSRLPKWDLVAGSIGFEDRKAPAMTFGGGGSILGSMGVRLRRRWLAMTAAALPMVWAGFDLPWPPLLDLSTVSIWFGDGWRGRFQIRLSGQRWWCAGGGCSTMVVETCGGDSNNNHRWAGPVECSLDIKLDGLWTWSQALGPY